ncbi:MAG TPA: DinB family protein [Ktedonobacteraceae bacterium]|nr:DinB family protein [Ktedonobacteraceae bacterium]
MLNAQDLSIAFARNVTIVKWQAEGLTNEDSLRQFPNGNCLNWALGHIAVNRDEVLRALGEAPEMGDAGARYKRGSEPLKDADEGILTLEELLAWLERSQERIASALDKVDETALAREFGTGDRKRTVGQSVFFLYFHESYHVGQTEMYRQFAGRGDKII